jgi:hypothetical protein
MSKSPSIKINYSPHQKEGKTIDDIHSVNRFNHKMWRREIDYDNVSEYQRQCKYEPSSFLIIDQKSKEWKQEIKRKDCPNKPSYPNNFNIRIGQQIETKGQICKTFI